MLSIKIALAVAFQFLFIWIPCLLGAWTKPTYESIKPLVWDVAPQTHARKLVDEWQWQWLNYWYANTEDGVSGQQAWVYDDADHLIPYTSLFTYKAKWWVALCWNLRNNANNLKRPLRTDGLTKAWQ